MKILSNINIIRCTLICTMFTPQEKIHKFINTDEIEITFENDENNSRKKITIVMDKRLNRRIDRAALIETLKEFKPRGPTDIQPVRPTKPTKDIK